MSKAIPEIDYKETTPCGGRVRYTINPDTDELTYCYVQNCKAGLVCKDCRGWQTLCPAFQEWMEGLK